MKTTKYTPVLGAECALDAPRCEGVAAMVDTVSVSFGHTQVLHDVSLAVPFESITVLVGRSGSGKTTLLRTFNRLNECLRECRTAGSVRIHLDGVLKDVYDSAFRDPSLLRTRIGMVFQMPDVVPVSIRRNMEIPMRHALGLPQSQINERLEQALQDVGLWEEVAARLDSPAEILSGGQQQRLCLARSLAMHPAMLLLDEPTASLDNVSARSIEALLSRLRSRYPVIMVSHSLGQALRLADRLVLMGGGRVQRCWDKRDGLPDIAELEALLEVMQEDDACCV